MAGQGAAGAKGVRAVSVLLRSEEDHLCASEAEPCCSSGASSSTDLLTAFGGRGRRAAKAAALFVALAAGTLGVAQIRSLQLQRRCEEANAAADRDPPTFEILAETFPEDLVHIPGTVEERRGAIEEWLAGANAVRGASGGAFVDEEYAEKAAETIKAAMSSEDPAEAQRYVKQTMNRAVKRMQEKRRELKRIAVRRQKEKQMGFLANGTKPEDRDLQVWGAHALPALSPPGNAWDVLPQGKSPARIASCFFGATGLVQGAAMTACSINDAVKTCAYLKPEDFFDADNAHAKVCAINLAATLAGFIGLATALAGATATCAFTLVPNVEALCAASGMGLIAATAQIGGAATLMAASCRQKGWYSRIMKGVSPSNVGSNERYLEHLKEKGELPPGQSPVRRLAEEDFAAPVNGTQSAPPRQLLFGGGKASIATQCAFSIQGAAWSVAYLGLNLKSASNKQGACPPKGLKGEKRSNDLIWILTENLCNIDISSAITSFLAIMLYIEFTVYQCTDVVNLQAICGSAFTALFAGMAGVSKAASGLYLACDLGMKPEIRNVIWAINQIYDFAEGQGFVRRLMEGDMNVFLEGAFKDEVDKLKQNYSSPEEVWREIGYDFNDREAEWRKKPIAEGMTKDDLVNMFEERTRGKAISPADILLGSAETCSS